MGDVLLLGAVGMWSGVAGVACSAFVGSAVGSIAILIHRRFSDKDLPLEIPYGPMLATGALIYLFVPDSWLAYHLPLLAR